MSCAKGEKLVEAAIQLYEERHGIERDPDNPSATYDMLWGKWHYRPIPDKDDEAKWEQLLREFADWIDGQ